MRIYYLGKNKEDGIESPVAVIEWKNKEEEKAQRVLDALDANAYTTDCLTGDGETSWAWFNVYDRDDYEEMKEIYLEAKRA